MITSAGNDWPSDVAIQGWREAGLNVPCKVRFKLFTLDDTLIVRKLGLLSKRDGEAVKKRWDASWQAGDTNQWEKLE